MTFNVNEFSAMVNKHGLARNNIFLAKLTLPRNLLEGTEMGNDLPFFCKSVDIPNLDLQSADVFNQGFGVAEKRPIGIQYGLIPAVFMVDSGFAIKTLFHRWSQLIFNTNDYYGMDNTINETQRPYELAYKDEYVGVLTIDVFSAKFPEMKYTYTFGNVYPQSIGSVTTAWENSSEIMTLPIGFAYDTFVTSSSYLGEYNPMLDRDNGMLSYTSALDAYGNIVNDIGQPENLQGLIDSLSKSYIRNR